MEQLMKKYSYENTVRFGNKLLPFWEFSNMSYDYPVDYNGIHFKTTEHLFFALRFNTHPEYQQEVIDYRPGITYLKRKFRDGKAYKPFHFEHWDEVCVDVMKFIVKLKYDQNEGFRKLLESTKGKIIIEDTTYQSSAKNNVQIWGAVDAKKKEVLTQLKKAKAPEEEIKKLVNDPYDELVGHNELGKILMELRDTGTISYNFKYPIFLLDKEVK